jgi:uncharacterized phage protein (TIGR01671 family)
MREIKFRIWSEREKEMICNSSNIFISLEGKIWISDYRIKDYSEISDYGLMQYTGMKDKNGIEIYEYDIVKTPAGYWRDNFIKANVGIIEYLDMEFFVTCPIPEYCQFNEFEIIGNIYENPELLENNA